MNAMPLVALALCLVAGPVAADAPQGAEGPVYKPGNGVSAPVLVKDVKPQYTPDAMRARVQGVVTLECVVQPDGTIGDVRVTKALDPDLDQEAIKAVKLWRFKPGLRDGKAVPVRVTLEMAFTMRDTPTPPLFPARPPAPAGAKSAGQPEAAPVYKAGGDVSAPVLVKDVKPQYTAEARRAGIQGIVELECVVETDGSVGNVTVTKSLDEGLDQEAVNAARQWTFEPGKKDGKAVRVQISLEMTFSLK